jgi:hypothetical protein
MLAVEGMQSLRATPGPKLRSGFDQRENQPTSANSVGSMARKILFDHIAKCAGSSVYALLQNGLGPDRVAPPLQGVSFSNAMRLFCDYDVVSGHFTGRIFIDTPFPVLRFTVVRHPVDRILSHYYYLKQLTSSGTDGIRSMYISLEEFIRTSEQESMAVVENPLCIHLADAIGPVTSSGALLPMAKEAVEYYDLVGVFEDIETTNRRICELCGLGPLSIPKINVTQTRKFADEIDPATLKLIVDKNHLDLELYRHIVDRFYQRESVNYKRSVNGHRAVSPMAKSPSNFGTYDVSIKDVSIHGAISGTMTVSSGEVLEIFFSLVSRVAEPNLVVCFIITDIFGDYVYGTDTMALGQKWFVESNATMEGRIRFAVNLGFGRYWISVVLYCGDRFTKKDYYHWAENVVFFDVRGNVGEPFFGYTKLNASIQQV